MDRGDFRGGKEAMSRGYAQTITEAHEHSKRKT